MDEKKNNPAKIYLMKYRALLLRYEELTENIRTLEARATNTAARIKAANVQSGSTQDTVGDVAVAVADAENMLSDTVRDIAQEMKGILRTIETVPDEMQKTILTKRYISGKSWSIISDEIGYERTTVWKLHGLALLSVGRALEGRKAYTF